MEIKAQSGKVLEAVIPQPINTQIQRCPYCNCGDLFLDASVFNYGKRIDVSVFVQCHECGFKTELNYWNSLKRR